MSIILVLLYVAFLVVAGFGGYWISNREGAPIPADFLAFWSAGRFLSLGGSADQLFSWDALRELQHSLGVRRDQYYPWLYPPSFLLLVLPLAAMPYTPAFLLWAAATLTSFIVAARTIVPSGWTAVAAVAFPPAMWTIMIGQNGLLSGALVAASLGLLERSPVLAGIYLGLLTYRPQLGLLFPLVLVAVGRWRTIAAAGATALLLVLISGFVFGVSAWWSFLQSLPQTSGIVLANGEQWYAKLQTVYGLVRWLGGSTAAGVLTQTLVAALVSCTVVFVWRGRSSFEVKGSLLASAILLVTPYAFTHDLTVLGVAIAFLVRAGLGSGFLPWERIVMTSAAAWLLVVTAAAPMWPLNGLVPTCGLLLLALRRALAERPH